MDTSYIMPVPLSEVNKTDWKFAGIYKITNTITGKCYIGQALDIRARLMKHANNKHPKKYVIYKAVEKYGLDNFEARILLIINTFGKTPYEIKKELNCHEYFYIDLYDSYNNGYNMTIEGDSWRLGMKHTKETIEKIKKAHQGYKPKAAKDSQKKTYGYDLITECFIEAESIVEMAQKSGVDYRSIGQICKNENYKEGGRFISKSRWLFSFNEKDLNNRIAFYISGGFKRRKQYNRKHYWVLWRERNGRFQQKDN